MKNFLLYSSILIVGFFSGFYYNDSIKEIPTPSANDISLKRIQEIVNLNQKSKEIKAPQKIESPKKSILKKDILQQNTNIDSKNKEEKFSKYDLFVSYLNTAQYQKALDIYQANVTNDNLKQYQNYLFDYVNNMIFEKDSNSLELINKFIAIEYNNTHALYLKAQILFQNKYFKEAILTLNNMKAFYLEKELEDKVNFSINDYATAYIQKLQEKQNHKELIDFLKVLLNQNPNNSKYTYILAKQYFDLNNYDMAKELLNKLVNDETYKNEAKEILALINKKIELSQKFTKKIKLQKNGDHFLIKAILNEDVTVTLLLDTGASVTIIDDSIMNKINYTMTNQNVELNTAGGFVTAKQVLIKTFSIDDTIVKDMQIVISKMYDNSFDGLLGMSFFRQFDFYIDQKNSILYLNAKLD